MITTFKTLAIVIACFVFLPGSRPGQIQQTAIPEVGMYKVEILYPGGKDKTFDMDYYEKNHMPFVSGLLGKNLKFYEIDKGVAGRTPADTIPFIAIGYFYCYDIAAYNQAIAQNRDAIVQDIRKYTNIQPVIQISQIRQLVPGR